MKIKERRKTYPRLPTQNGFLVWVRRNRENGRRRNNSAIL